MKKISIFLTTLFVFFFSTTSAFACIITVTPNQFYVGKPTPTTITVTNNDAVSYTILAHSNDARFHQNNRTIPSGWIYHPTQAYSTFLEKDSSTFNPGDTMSFTADFIAGFIGGSSSMTPYYSGILTNSAGTGPQCSTEIFNLGYFPPQFATLSGTTIQAGQEYTENGSFEWTYPDVNISTTDWITEVDYGDGTGFQPIGLSGSNTNRTFSLSHIYSTPGTYTVTVRTTTFSGNTGTVGGYIQSVVQVEPAANQAPEIEELSNITVNEGEDYNQAGLFSDPDSNTWTGTVNYGDGTGEQPLTLSETTFALNHTYKDSGSYTVTVSVTDNQGAVSTKTATVTVTNVAPTVGTVIVNPSPAHINSAVTASASFTDPGVLDTHTVTINWGDGNTTSGTVNETTGTVSGDHTYTSFGTYTITVTVTDKDTATSDNTTSLTVVKQLTAVSPATVYISKTLPIIATRFDLKAEVYKDNTLVTSGQLNSVNPGLGATVATIPFNSFSAIDFPTGSTLKIQVYARTACTGALLANGTARLYYNASSVDSRFGATIGTVASTYHLRNGFVLSTSVGALQQTASINTGARCSAFKPFGTWTIAP